MVDRQVRWNSQRSKNNPDSYTWWFLIINTNKREIEKINKRIEDLVLPIFDEAPVIKGKYAGTKLKYELRSFDSKNSVDLGMLKDLYVNVVEDTNLYHRETSSGLEIYVSKLNQ